MGDALSSLLCISILKRAGYKPNIYLGDPILEGIVRLQHIFLIQLPFRMIIERAIAKSGLDISVSSPIYKEILETRYNLQVKLVAPHMEPPYATSLWTEPGYVATGTSVKPELRIVAPGAISKRYRNPVKLIQLLELINELKSFKPRLSLEFYTSIPDKAFFKNIEKCFVKIEPFRKYRDMTLRKDTVGLIYDHDTDMQYPHLPSKIFDMVRYFCTIIVVTPPNSDLARILAGVKGIYHHNTLLELVYDLNNYPKSNFLNNAGDIFDRLSSALDHTPTALQ